MRSIFWISHCLLLFLCDDWGSKQGCSGKEAAETQRPVAGLLVRCLCQEAVVSSVSLRICPISNFLRLWRPRMGLLILELNKFHNQKRRHVRVEMYFCPVPVSGLEAGMWPKVGVTSKWHLFCRMKLWTKAYLDCLPQTFSQDTHSFLITLFQTGALCHNPVAEDQGLTLSAVPQDLVWSVIALNSRAPSSMDDLWTQFFFS